MSTSKVSADYNVWDEDADPGADVLYELSDDGIKGALDSIATASGPAMPIALCAGPEAHGVRLDKWLAGQLSTHSRGRLQGWIEAGAVTLNGSVATVRQTVRNGDRVVVTPQQAAEDLAFRAEPMALAIVHEDAVLLVLDKPAGLVVHPAAGNWSGTLLNGLLHHLPSLARLPRAGIVHRLDKDTSGLMVVAKTEAAQTDLVRQLQARTVRREYLAVVHGVPMASGTVDAPIGRNPKERVRMAVFKAPGPACKPAVTHYRVLDSVEVERPGMPPATYSLIACRLETGRTHQIRVHMQSLGHPLVGDPLYGGLASGRSGRVATVPAMAGFARQALHARRLGLVHPETRAACTWCSPPPADFTGLVERLGLDVALLAADAG